MASAREEFRKRYSQGLPDENHKRNKTLAECMVLLTTTYTKEEETNNWEQRKHALLQFRVFTVQQAFDSVEEIFWHKLKIGLAQHIKDLRLGIAREAMLTAANLIEEVPRCRTITAEYLLDASFRQLRSKAKTLSADAWTCIQIIVKTVKTKQILANLKVHQTSDAAVDREKAVESYKIVLQRWPNSIVEMVKTDFIISVQAALSDADKNVRSAARSCYRHLHDTWPTEAPELPAKGGKNESQARTPISRVRPPSTRPKTDSGHRRNRSQATTLHQRRKSAAPTPKLDNLGGSPTGSKPPGGRLRPFATPGRNRSPLTSPTIKSSTSPTPGDMTEKEQSTVSAKTHTSNDPEATPTQENSTSHNSTSHKAKIPLRSFSDMNIAAAQKAQTKHIRNQRSLNRRTANRQLPKWNNTSNSHKLPAIGGKKPVVLKTRTSRSRASKVSNQSSRDPSPNANRNSITARNSTPDFTRDSSQQSIQNYRVRVISNPPSTTGSADKSSDDSSKNGSMGSMSSRRSRIPIRVKVAQKQVRVTEQMKVDTQTRIMPDLGGLPDLQNTMDIINKSSSGTYTETELISAFSTLNGGDQSYFHQNTQARDSVLNDLIHIIVNPAFTTKCRDYAALSMRLICNKQGSENSRSVYKQCLSKLVENIIQMENESNEDVEVSNFEKGVADADTRFDLLRQAAYTILDRTAWPDALQLLLPNLRFTLILRLLHDKLQMPCEVIDGDDIMSEEWIDAILTPLSESFKSKQREVRKHVVFCIAELHNKCGDHICPVLEQKLESAQVKLVNVYIKKNRVRQEAQRIQCHFKVDGSR